MIYSNILETIGNTPVINLESNFIPNGKKLLLKLEQFNPCHSIKDRAVLGLVLDAERKGMIQKGDTLIETTSGNVGKALAMIGAVLGYKVIIVVDKKVSSRTSDTYKAYGAKVIIISTPDESGSMQTTRINKIKQLLEDIPRSFWINQYDNPANLEFHYNTTAHEIMEHETDLFVSAIGTGGHISGIGKKLKERGCHTHILGADVVGSAIFNKPYFPYSIHGVGLEQKALNTKTEYIDKLVIIDDFCAISMCHIIAKEHGILLGGSGGLAICAGILALNKYDYKSALVIIPDGGNNYIESIFNNDYITEKDVRMIPRNELIKYIITNYTIGGIEAVSKAS